VRVGVIDSGVTSQPRQRVESRPPVYDVSPEYAGSMNLWHQGTAVAGLINGPEQDGNVVGIAPGAEVVAIPVYDVPASTEEDSESDAVELDADNVVAGLRAAASLRLDIVNVSLEVEHTPELLRAVRDLTDDGVIVVAASGDVPAEGSPFEGDVGTGSGDDAAQEIFPAGYASFRGERDPLVVAVTSTVPDGVDPLSVVLPSSATTVAAPSAGGVSFGVNGVRCRLGTPSSVYAAATVSGVLALLKSRFPDENGRQLVARLTATAAGPPASDPMLPNRFLGDGVVQPVEALTRAVDPAVDGTVDELSQPTAPNQPAAIDPPDPDLLASAREDAVWWALGAGGLMAVLLLLRPVIGRRRRQES
jgi:membrane-anchored mycosin MYCP